MHHMYFSTDEWYTYCPTCQTTIPEANGAGYAQHHILGVDESPSQDLMQPRVYLRDLHTRQLTQIPANPLLKDAQHEAIDLETLSRRAPTSTISCSICWFKFQFHS
ncbi:hypothetical protein HBI04_140610 [Parastagonospora nodorum]|nr:hypothetical protein HBH47_201830 [Parastagonospora nodorum]KAH4257539.1 hypothetical protein HBI03_153920 [Parastagonospora nodorum]KAH4272913.1 hypothetical protein HBI04_140610 [Parastagonospora nodorum]KAH4932032.1 hypothetical protein HBI79_105530 [Parastagonospora nodorum]KAH5363262.1 hypothetical protein HBI48_080550 [Parastagonospora nodorum]